MVRKKIIVIILIFVLSMFFVCTTSMANSGSQDGGGGEDAMSALWTNDKLSEVKSGVSAGDYTKGLFGGINTIIGLIQVAGTGISIIMVTMLGIKYILASVEEKAEIKKTAMPIVIGAVLLFGAVNIIGVLEEFGDILNKSETGNG